MEDVTLSSNETVKMSDHVHIHMQGIRYMDLILTKCDYQHNEGYTSCARQTRKG